MKSPMAEPTPQEIDEIIVRLAKAGLQGPELITEAATALRCRIGVVRRLLQNRYPGLLKAASKERPSAERVHPGQHARGEKIPARHSDVYRLPSRKRQGGHTF